MSLTLDQFVRNLVESRLMTAAEVAEFQQQLPLGRRASDAEALAKEMVRQNVLTKFQAAALYQGRTKELVFGPYIVLDKLGAGKMGFVYKARHRELGLIFAVKVLPARRIVESPKSLARFQREVALHVRLSHPNIVRVHDAGEAWGLPYLVMEFVDGQDLDSLVQQQGPLPPTEATECTRQAAEGLAYAHREGIIHRDVKPANLLLDQAGTVKILDLGLGRFDEQVLGEEEGGARLTTDMQILGTPNFMAPEQASNPRLADARCDVYSLGCTLFYLLTGRAPFQADTPIRTLLAHRTNPVPSLRSERDDVPESLDAIFQKMLAKSAEERFQSMDEVVAALSGRPLPAAAPPPLPPAPPPPPQTAEPAREPAAEPVPMPVLQPLSTRPSAASPRSWNVPMIVGAACLALVVLYTVARWLGWL
jgi:serine/threonine protein kinase